MSAATMMTQQMIVKCESMTTVLSKATLDRIQLGPEIPKGRLTVTQARALKCGDIVRGASSGHPYLYLEQQDLGVRQVRGGRMIRLWVKRFRPSAFTDVEEEKYGIGHSAFKCDIIKPTVIASAVGNHFLTTKEARLIKVGDLVKISLGWAIEGERIFRVIQVHEVERNGRGTFRYEYSLVSVKYPDLGTVVPHRKVKEILRYPNIQDLESYEFPETDTSF